MALCFAHTAAGYLAYEMARPSAEHHPGLLAAAVTLANAADLDFVPGVLIGHPAEFHRGVTHTVLAAVVVAIVIALVVRLTGRPRRAWLRAGAWAGAVYASHLVLDFFTADVVVPSGVPLFWPFSDAYYLSPVTPLGEIIIDPSGRTAFVKSLFTPDTTRVWAVEITIFLLTVCAVQAFRAWRLRPAIGDTAEDL
jgi:inner membrane protein